MQDVKIVRLGPADVARFKAIRFEALRTAPGAFGNTVADWEALSDAEWRDRLRTPVFVMMAGDDPIGIMGLLIQRGTKKCHRATLIMAYLRQSARGRGLADDLLDAVIAHARASGVCQIELNVSHTNAAAIRFYERRGFEQVGRIPCALIEDTGPVDELIMMCRFGGLPS